jgi:hypothetical protein
MNKMLKYTMKLLPPATIRSIEDVLKFTQDNTTIYSITLYNKGTSDILFQGNRIKPNCTATISPPSEGGTISVENLSIVSVQNDTTVIDWTGCELLIQCSYLDNFRFVEI